MACLLKPIIVKSAETAIAREQLSSHHVKTITNTHRTIEKLLEVVFFVQPMPIRAVMCAQINSLDNEWALPLNDVNIKYNFSISAYIHMIMLLVSKFSEK